MRRPVRRGHGERGAVAILVALTTSAVLMTIAAFGVDLGMQRVARRDMQALADIVSLDLARQVDEVTTQGEVISGPDWVPAIQRSVASNITPWTGHDSAGNLIPDVGKVHVSITPAGANDAEVTIDGEEEVLHVVLGRLDYDTGAFTPTALAGDIPNAVKVTAETAVSFNFIQGSGAVARSAVADNSQWGCFKVGSWLARADLDDPTLLPAQQVTAQVDLLVTQINATLGLGPVTLPTSGGLTALGYDGLADASVSLADLVDVDSLSVGSVSELLSTDVRVADLLTAMATVLRTDNTTASVHAATILDGVVSAGVGLFNQTTAVVRLGELLHIDTAPPSVADVGLNVFDLMASSIAIANGGSFVSVPLDVSLGLVDPRVQLDVIEPPQLYCGHPGGDPIHTTQVRATISSDINAGTSVDTNLLGAVHLSLNPQPGTLDVGLGVADSTASLSSVDCDPDGMTVAVQSALVDADISVGIPVSGGLSLESPPVANPAALLNPTLSGYYKVVLSEEVGARISAGAHLDSTAAGDNLDLQLPPNDTTPLSTDSGLGDGPALSLPVSVAGTVDHDGNPATPAKTVGPLVVKVVDDHGHEVTGPLLSTLLDGLLNPVVGGLTTTMISAVNLLTGQLTSLATSLVNPLAGSVDHLLDVLPSYLPLSLTGVDVWGLHDDVAGPHCASTSLRG